MRHRVASLWDWVVASDPGLTRLRTAFNVAMAMATSLLVEYGVSWIMGAQGVGIIVAMLMGSVVAMMGSQALAGSDPAAKTRIAALFPPALGAGIVAGIAVGRNTDLLLSIFVVVMFVAVAIRHFGMAHFFYGFMLWMGYFFASFTGATWAEFPFLFVAVLTASAWILLLSSTFLKTRPNRVLWRTIGAFGLRARAVAAVIHDLLLETRPDAREHLRLRLRMRATQLAETALMVEAWMVEPQALPPGWSALAVRRRLLNIQHLIDRMAADAVVLAGSGTAAAGLAAAVAQAIAHAEDQRAVQVLVHLEDAEGPERWAAIDFSQAAAQFLALAAEVRLVREHHMAISDSPEFEPAVELFLENLPGSPATVRDVPARGSHWNPMARLDLALRQAIQVAVSGGLAIVFGRWLSPERYYWAVIAAFIMSAGTATRVEAMLKGVNRVVGTLAGLVAAVAVAEGTAGHVFLAIAAIVVSMFFGFYFIRVSYAYFIFFLTVMLGQLYSILHEFSPGLLVLRLEETAVGAAAGILAALLIVPLSTRDSIQFVRHAFLTELRDFMNLAGESIKNPQEERLDRAVRMLENRYRQLLQVADPVTPPLAWGYSRPRVRHRLGLYAALTGYVRTLAVALREASAEDRSQALQDVCWGLAKAVGTIQAAAPTGTAIVLPATEPLLQSGRINPIARPLHQIRELLIDFTTSEPLP